MIQQNPDTSSTTVIEIKQTVRPGGFDTANKYVLDGETRTDTVPMFGAMSMRAQYVGRAEASDILNASSSNMGKDLETPLGGDGEGRVGISEISQGVNTGWKTVAVWGFQRLDGERRFCKYCITTKGDQKAEARLVYDYRALPIVAGR